MRSSSHEPVPFVNIGVIAKNLGTVSDVNGAFKLKIPDVLDEDTIQVSSVGYTVEKMTVQDFKTLISKDSVLFMDEDIQELQEVVVIGKELKEKNIGKKTRSKMLRGGFKNAALGNQIGTKISVRKTPLFVERFNTYVTANTRNDLKFRINFYDLKDGLPNDKIVQENIVFELGIESGEFSLDLSKYNIVIDDDFAVAVELIENPGNKDHEVYFSVGLFGNVLIQSTSQAKWEKTGTVGLGFNLTVKHDN